jgi:hypothetical protein
MFGREHIFCERADTKITCCVEFGPDSTVRFNMLGNQVSDFWHPHAHAGRTHYDNAHQPSLPVLLAPEQLCSGLYRTRLRATDDPQTKLPVKAMPGRRPGLLPVNQPPTHTPDGLLIKQPPATKAAGHVVPPATAAPAVAPPVMAKARPLTQPPAKRAPPGFGQSAASTPAEAQAPAAAPVGHVAR